MYVPTLRPGPGQDCKCRDAGLCLDLGGVGGGAVTPHPRRRGDAAPTHDTHVQPPLLHSLKSTKPCFTHNTKCTDLVDGDYNR